MPKHDADIRGRLAIVYNGETVTSKTNASNPQVGDPCHTLGATGAGRAVVIENHAKAFSFDSLASNSMKSTNPHSGCREVGVSKTLDATRPDPTAYHALKPIMQEDAALEGKVNFLIKVLKFIIAESGFELLARIELKDKKTGRCFR